MDREVILHHIVNLHGLTYGHISMVRLLKNAFLKPMSLLVGVKPMHTKRSDHNHAPKGGCVNIFTICLKMPVLGFFFRV